MKEQPARPRLSALSTSGAFCEKSLRQDSLPSPQHRQGEKVSHKGPFITGTQYNNNLPTQYPLHTKEKW